VVGISLYFHFPFCIKKCPYCHFYVVPSKNHDFFLKALLKEWEIRFHEIEGREIVSVYFGGGTPILFIKGIQAILKRIQAREITVETNPENVTSDQMKRLQDLGVNRISIGVQSLSNFLLKHLGRSHTAQQATDAIEIAHEVGIKNISIDLMYEIPYQTFDIWEETVKKVCRLPIMHLSLYNLTFEPHTVFKKKERKLKPHLPKEEIARAMLDTAVESFEQAGLKRYEISAFARNDQFSIHNVGYWTDRPFIGFGPSAFSYFKGKRFRNVCNMNHYIKKLNAGVFPVDFEEKLSPIRSLHETLAVGLRLIDGISFSNLPLSTQEILEKLSKEKWIFYKNGHAKLTEKGRLFYDTVAEKIIL